MLKRPKAQSLAEYVLLIGIVMAVAAVMFPMVKRGTQSLIKAGADQIGDQRRSEQDYTAATGYTEGMNMSIRTVGNSEKREWPGVFQTVTYDNTATDSNTVTNMGFTKE